MKRALVSAWMGLLVACTAPGGSDGGVSSSVHGDGFASVESGDATSVRISFSRKLDKGSAGANAFSIHDRTVLPFVNVEVSSASAGDQDVTLGTGTMEPGRTYTLAIAGLKDEGGNSLDGTLNFQAGGVASKAQVTFLVDDAARIRAWGALALDITADPSSGAFQDRVQRVVLQPMGGALAVVVELQVDARRTVDRRDDGDPVVDRRAFAVRPVTVEGGHAAGPLVAFEVASAQAQQVVVSLFDPPMVVVEPGNELTPPVDSSPGDGKKRVRLVVDDRRSRELTSPALKLFFDADGQFDLAAPRTVALEQPVEPRLYEITVDVKVDPNRTREGMDETTLPYVVVLVNAGTDVDAINTVVIAPEEAPEVVVVPLGDAARTPVTFQVDTAKAYLTMDGAQRGVFPGEAVFITGEWQSAADALGRNAGDAFSGGEQTTLEMKPDPDHPGVWFKTVWLTAGRPYGWKVVRCAAGIGCGPLNRLVASSGRAFATVMKNLVTENLDAFADQDTQVVDPNLPQAVAIPGGPADYSSATLYQGNGMGGESNPPWAPRAQTLFKQEVPDLAVVVGDQPLVTPVFVVGTWRDVNSAKRPAQIVTEQSVLDITPLDYDQGFIGRYPPTRSAP